MQQVYALQGMGAFIDSGKITAHQYPFGMQKDQNGKAIKANDARYYCGKTKGCPASTLSAAQQKEYAAAWAAGGSQARLIKGTGSNPRIKPATTTRTTATKTPSTGRGGSTSKTARGTVNQQKANAKPVQSTVDNSYTSIQMSRLIGDRPARVSPLAQSWQFALQPTSPVTVIQAGGGFKWAMIGLGVLFVGGAIWLLAKD
jgi:hypothetical protein